MVEHPDDTETLAFFRSFGHSKYFSIDNNHYPVQKVAFSGVFLLIETLMSVTNENGFAKRDRSSLFSLFCFWFFREFDANNNPTFYL